MWGCHRVLATALAPRSIGRPVIRHTLLQQATGVSAALSHCISSSTNTQSHEKPLISTIDSMTLTVKDVHLR